MRAHAVSVERNMLYVSELAPILIEKPVPTFSGHALMHDLTQSAGAIALRHCVEIDGANMRSLAG